MPLYEYHCQTCDKRVEVLVLSPAREARCPDCGGPLGERLVSVPYVARRSGQDFAGLTCCGREDRCDVPPCEDSGVCRRD
ncbi:MAG: zinc ribbon domain-containing protein [Chloroflexota bacterium]